MLRSNLSADSVVSNVVAFSLAEKFLFRLQERREQGAFAPLRLI